jgi:glycosyltransferase involved in cell wall biosynthesis
VKRKLLVVTGRLDTLGGTEIYLQRMMAGLCERGVDVCCYSGGRLSPGPYHHIVDADLHDDHVLTALAALGRLDHLMRVEGFHAVYVANLRCPEILELLARHPRSLCHVHDHRYTCPATTRLLAGTDTICPRPASVMCLALCGLPAWRKHGHLPRWAKELGGFAACTAHARRFAHVLVASHMVKDSLIANGFDPRTIIVLPGFAPGRDPTLSPLPSPPFRALFVGRLDHGKGVDVLLQAMPMCPDMHVTVIGAGPAHFSLMQLARELGLTDRITFTGALPYEAVARAMRASHVVVIPSRWPEPFGLVGVEAMSVGRAVIGSRAGGIPEWLSDGETGLLVPPGIAQALAAALARLAADRDELHRMGQQAWQAAQAFLPETHLDHIMAAANL